MTDLNNILQNYKFPSDLNIHVRGEQQNRIEFTLPVQIPDDIKENLPEQDFFDESTIVSKKQNKNTYIIKGDSFESQVKTLLYILNNIQYNGKPIFTKSYINQEDKNKKNKSKISINRFKPKIRMIDEPSSDSTEKSDSNDSNIKDIYEIDDNESSYSGHKIESNNSEYDYDNNDNNDNDDNDNDDNDNDSDSLEKESSKTQNITFSKFNSYELQEKQETIQKLIENTTNDSLKEKLLNIDNILKFLSKYETIYSPNCFELSVDNPNMKMTSKNGSKTKNLLNANISNKTIKFFNRNSKLGQFLKLFKKFDNVSINIIKKSSSKVFDKLVENIQNLHDGKYKQFNIVLTINKTVIEESEFENNKAIKSVILSPSVETIEKHAFYNCESLRDVTFSDSIKEIGVGAFQNCKSLQEAIIPDSVTTMSVFAFCDCHSLKKVKLSSSLNFINIGTFKFCKNLTDIQIPDSINFIGNEAFQSCFSLVQIDIPDSVKRINDFAFAYCSSLRQIKVSKSVRYGNKPFEKCLALKKNPALSKNSENRSKNSKNKIIPHVKSSAQELSEDSDIDLF